MVIKMFLQSTRKDDLRFEILKVDVQNKRATLKGPLGVEFDERIDPEFLEQYGYKVVREVQSI